MEDQHPDSTFAPQSPDLDAFTDIDPLPPQHQTYRGSISHTLTPFTPTDAKSPWASNAPYSASSRTSGWGQQQQSYFPPQPQQSYRGSTEVLQNFTPPAFKQDPFAARGNGATGEEASWDPMAPSTRGNRVKPEPDAEYDEEPMQIGNGANGGPRAEIEVKTKFPVARIKRIMQSDEDVGKVAQVTPVVVSKALELFMIDLVTTAATEAKSRSSKRVTAAHLKTAVMNNEKYKDWLSEIVSKAPDAPTAAAKKEEADSDDDFFGSSGGAKKKRKGTRKRKGGDDD